MSWSQPAWNSIADLVGRRTGLTFGNRCDSAELSMRRAMARAKTTDPRLYFDLIAREEPAFDDLVSELTVGETYFFREPGHFEMIRRDVLPEVRRRRGPDHMIRVWSAGCASGEEAYSLAMLFAEEERFERVHVLATDISRQALAKTRQAVYAEWSLRGEQGRAALPHLTAVGNQFRLDEAIRRRVTVESLDLALDVYPSFASGVWGMDLILCRNVLIYFDRETVAKVARRLFQTLAEGGWLITASSDPPLWESAPFEVVSAQAGLFYRRPLGGTNPLHEGTVNGLARRPADKPIDQPRPLTETGVVLDSVEADSEPWSPTNHPETIDCAEETRRELERDDGARVSPHAENSAEELALTAQGVRALANVNLAQAERTCVLALERFPFATELHYLHAVLLLGLGRIDEAIASVRRVIYLDRSLAIAHFTLGSLLRKRGDLGGAHRAFRNARDLCVQLSAGAVLPLGDGEAAGRLAEVASGELALLKREQGGT